MRFTLSVIALAAIGAQAVPQVNPISQISDGQIQAPPATTGVPTTGAPAETTGVPTAPGATEVLPTTAPATEAPTEAPTVVVPVPTGPANSTIVVPTPLPTLTNGTVTTGSPTSSGGSNSPSSSPSGGAPQQSDNAASSNLVSFGGLALAVFAMLA